METIERGGEHYRVADPDLENPLDGTHSMRYGGRWNAPGSFPVTYLNANIGTAKANARRLLTVSLRGQPFSAEDLERSELPVLISVDVPRLRYLDIVTPGGCVANGLPSTYPLNADGMVVQWSDCQPIGQRSWDEGLPGIACRSAAEAAPADGEELPWFDRHEFTLVAKETKSFDEWYGPFDW
jgi:RES domain-containing protein